MRNGEHFVNYLKITGGDFISHCSGLIENVCKVMLNRRIKDIAVSNV